MDDQFLDSSRFSGNPTLYGCDFSSYIPKLKHQQFTRQLISYPFHQPASQPARQPVSQPAHQPASQPARQPVSQPAHQPASQPASYPVLQPAAPDDNPVEKQVKGVISEGFQGPGNSVLGVLLAGIIVVLMWQRISDLRAETRILEFKIECLRQYLQKPA